MAADLARITYDPTRQYRSVVAQQGRVTLEADSNEATIIADEALRLETIDVVGPTGTPDNGYKVGSGTGPGGVSIAPGLLYLGGWRLELDAPIDLSAQPDWLDAPAATAAQGNLLVSLLLTEQDVSATEDQALREVALGGPDSAGRTRLMQQFLRLPLAGDTCAAGATDIASTLSAEGVTIDPATLQLLSAARLTANFVPGPAVNDPCTPAAAGGYLGADNQLVRVTVIACSGGAGTLLWGFNNASLLYRASIANPQTLTLTGTPVDEEHAPQLGQAVEILRSRTSLGGGNYIAAPEGFVTTLTQAYSFDTGQLGLAAPLPPDYQADKNPLFVRLWQAAVPFTSGQVTPLDTVSGITVTITMTALPTTIALRPVWRFAVRPSTPVVIYPQRYQDATNPQPPDGPRQWLTDLAVVQALSAGSALLADCRVPFLPLTLQKGGCCSLVLGPADVAGRGGLQAVMDSLAGTTSIVSLTAGTYTLAEPLVLVARHAGLTLEACGPGVTLAANTANLTAFRFGMILLDTAADITLSGLDFSIPNVPADPAPTAAPMAATPMAANTGTVAMVARQDMLVRAPAPAPVAATAGTASFNTGTVVVAPPTAPPATMGTVVASNPVYTAEPPVAAAAPPPSTSVGILAVASANLTVQDCAFAAVPDSAQVFGAALYVLGQSAGLAVRRNKFIAGAYQAGGMIFGLLATVMKANATTTLDNAEIADNVFRHLTAGVAVYSQLGMVRCTGNRVVQCATGLFFADSDLAATSEVARQASVDATQSQTLAPALTAGLQAPLLTTMLNQSDTFAVKAPAPAATAVSDTARTALVQTAATRATTNLRLVAASPDAAILAPAVAAAPAATPSAPAAQPAAVALDPTFAASLTLVQDVAVAAEVAGTKLTPVLHIAGNDVALAATGAAPGVGVAVVLSPRDNLGGTVLMTANRVVTADARTEAGAILYPAVAAVTGNVFLQTGDSPRPPIPGFMLLAEATARIEVMANVVHSPAVIAPARTQLPTTSWAFLNTSG
jgi:hypothetical protein